MFSSKTLTLELQLPAGQILVNLVKNNFTDSKIIPEQNLGFKTIIFARNMFVKLVESNFTENFHIQILQSFLNKLLVLKLEFTKDWKQVV